MVEVEIDKWLWQFERLGNHRTVGEHLLQLIDVLPLADLSESLSMDSNFYGAELVVGFNNDKWGKSWGTVSTLIRKQCPAASLFPITEAIEKGGHPKVLRLVEDGLFSGTEMRAIFDSLRGNRPPGRSQKVSLDSHFSCGYQLEVLAQRLGVALRDLRQRFRDAACVFRVPLELVHALVKAVIDRADGNLHKRIASTIRDLGFGLETSSESAVVRDAMPGAYIADFALDELLRDG